MTAPELRGASVLRTAEIFGLPHHLMRRYIREGKILPRAAGRSSICIFSEVEEFLKSLPKTKSPEACHAA